MKEERDVLLGEGSAYKMEKEKLEKTLLEEDAVLKEITPSVEDVERILNPLKTEKSMLIESNKKLVSCSSKTTESGGRITGKLLKHIVPVYLEFLCTLRKQF